MLSLLEKLLISVIGFGFLIVLFALYLLFAVIFSDYGSRGTLAFFMIILFGIPICYFIGRKFLDVVKM